MLAYFVTGADIPAEMGQGQQDLSHVAGGSMDGVSTSGFKKLS